VLLSDPKLVHEHAFVQLTCTGFDELSGHLNNGRPPRINRNLFTWRAPGGTVLKERLPSEWPDLAARQARDDRRSPIVSRNLRRYQVPVDFAGRPSATTRRGMST
jgi:hypothetical protein